MKVLALQLAAALLCGVVAGPARSEIAPNKITVDPTSVIGPVKPVNGVGQPPMVGALKDWPMFHYLKEAGIPYSRLHDVGGRLGGGIFVDIPNLFPDFDADEDDPANYNFAFTDSLMKALVENGVEPFFRLGVSIENWVFYGKGLPALRTKPPKDFAKWARICEHVIRHYTEGWADGFQMKVEYWEIWNEPEGASMFGGPWKEFMRLYGTAAPYLKSRFPHLKIGGYGCCGFYAGVEAEFVEAANIAPNLKLYLDCANKFLAAARDNGWPLDFFSFHSYSAPKDALRQVCYADRLLDQYGFTHDKTERIFDEWLPFPTRESLGTADQAAAIAAELIGLQNGPCDLACIYDARCNTGSYSALFNPLTQKPHKAYWAFVAFNELRKRGTAIEVGGPRFVAAAEPINDAARTEPGPPVYSAAAKGADGSIAVMLANPGGKEVPLAIEVADDSKRTSASRCRVVDAARTWEEIPLPAALPPHSILVVEFP
ncbi:MAG: hypothetical protein IKO40_02150 [Kiritimatiellae bacterium]|nr:hypothetical protein [Kiritimatiellia bacterium]